MVLPIKCLVDTNVPLTANKQQEQEKPKDLIKCVLACVKAIEHVIENRCLVIDSGNEIYDEYCHKLSFAGQPGVGDRFLRWVHDNRFVLPEDHRVSITKNENTYDEFPCHSGLQNFDLSDKKFVAVSNAHPEKPPILQATDSKWWGWKDALAEEGIEVVFLCEDYVKEKYEKKIGVS